MISNMLSVPFWGCENIPLDTLLAETIDREFYQPAAAFGDVARAHMLHSQVALGIENGPVDLVQYNQILSEFYYFVADVAAKLPDHVVTFRWHNTLYHHPVTVEARDWAHEQQVLVLQTGFLYLALANSQNVHSDDGLKQACAFFQYAAGCFQHYLDTAKGHDFNGIDTATVQCLRAICVGQAQELVWQKAVRGGAMKATAIARLAAKVADFYREASGWGTQAASIRQEWLNHLQTKTGHFQAAAHFRMAAHALDTFEYGVQVAHLKAALAQCIEAVKYQRYVAQVVKEDLAGLHTAVAETLSGAERDNDLVYLKLVPEPADLALIVGVAMATAKTPPFLTERDAKYAPAFKDLMPFAVVQVSQAFRERQDSFITSAFHEPLAALTRTLHQFLAARELPAILDAAEIPEGLPESIVQHAQDIIGGGGTRSLDRTMAELQAHAKSARELVAECEQRLNLEKNEDDLMREREGPERWTRIPSASASSQHWATVQKMHDYLKQGAQSDAALAETYAQIRALLAVYAGGHHALLKHIPQHTQGLERGTENAARELRNLLTKATKLELEREQWRARIDLKSRDHSVLAVVVDAYKRHPAQFQDENGFVAPVKFEPIYETHVEFFDADLHYVSELRDKQLDLETRIEQASEKFRHASENGNSEKSALTPAQKKRLVALQTLENAYVKYLGLVQNLAHATKFYASFMDRGNAVLSEIDAFLRNRREDARALALEIDAQRNLEAIENSMTLPHNIAAPRLQKPNHLWDPATGIRFT